MGYLELFKKTAAEVELMKGVFIPGGKGGLKGIRVTVKK